MKNRTDKEQLVRCHDLDSEDISQEECHYLSQKEKSRVDRIKKEVYQKDALDRAENACISCHIDQITHRY